MARYGRSRSKQAMQKLIDVYLSSWNAVQTFDAIQLTPAAGFDDEVIVKRLMVGAALQPQTEFEDDQCKGVLWAILQTQTDAPPSEADMQENNLRVAGGVFNAYTPLWYNETITMRKLSGSSLWLTFSIPLSLSGTALLTSNVQVHYVED